MYLFCLLEFSFGNATSITVYGNGVLIVTSLRTLIVEDTIYAHSLILWDCEIVIYIKIPSVIMYTLQTKWISSEIFILINKAGDWHQTKDFTFFPVSNVTKALEAQAITTRWHVNIICYGHATLITDVHVKLSFQYIHSENYSLADHSSSPWLLTTMVQRPKTGRNRTFYYH